MSKLIFVRLYSRLLLWIFTNLFTFQVTGASGFLASHIIWQLLESGYRVRATARGKKVGALKELYRAHPNIEIIEVPDIVHSEFAEAFVGVDAVVHTAAPLPARVDPQTMLDVSGVLRMEGGTDSTHRRQLKAR